MTLIEYRSGLRVFLRDHADLNRLLKFEEENRDDSLDLYLNMAVGTLNALPPPVGNYGVDGFPIPGLLIHQAAIECLISNGILGARNELTYNNGGISVKIEGRDSYLPAINELRSLVAREVESFIKHKIGINVQGAWGGSFSPYLKTSYLF